VSGISALRSASVRTAVTAVTVPVAAGSLCLIFAPYASASVGIGLATVAAPGATAASPLRSGGSSTPFTVALPAHAACPGDTAHDGYHVYSYLVPAGTDLSSVTFLDYPSTGYGLVEGGRYYGAVNTAIHTGQIVGIPNDFEWASLIRTGGAVPVSTLLNGPSHGVWETGIACADSRGTLSHAWNAQVTFTGRSTDPHGFRWTAAPAGVTASTSPTGSTAGGGSTVPATGTSGATGTVAGRVGTSGSSTGSGGSSGSGKDATSPTTKASAPAADDAPVDVLLAFAVVVLIGLVLLVGRAVRAGRWTE